MFPQHPDLGSQALPRPMARRACSTRARLAWLAEKHKNDARNGGMAHTTHGISGLDDTIRRSQHDCSGHPHSEIDTTLWRSQTAAIVLRVHRPKKVLGPGSPKPES